MRRRLIVGNWKMHGHGDQLRQVEAIDAAFADFPSLDAALCLPATLIHSATQQVRTIRVGAQDVHHADFGPHTGNLSAAMLREAGATLTIVGHSERRIDQHETDAEVKAKAEAAHRQGLDVIVCVGETLERREAGEAEACVVTQLAASLPAGASGAWLSIAYEPVWAIGTGRIPTLDEVSRMHVAIRSELWRLIEEAAAGVRILYGGSVNQDNAAALLCCPNVDGALVGGASLAAETFVPILAIASAATGNRAATIVTE